MKYWNDFVRAIESLGVTFQYMSGEDQVRFITTLSRIVTIACATVLITLFYPFIPAPIRLVAVPLILFGSWFVATHVVASIIVSQFHIDGRSGTLDVIDVTEEEFETKSNSLYSLGELSFKYRATIARVGAYVGFVLALVGFLYFSLVH